MDNSFQTSFIPKKPINQSISGVSGKEPVSFFSIITTIILIISILASGGLFGYKLYLTKQKQKLSSSLLISRDSFEKDTISELDLFYQRSKSAKEILSNHVVLSPIFSLLDEITIPQVQYTSFSQQINDKGVFTISISGIASDYNSIALQANVFNTEKGSSFKDVLFSNLVKDKDGDVNFNLKFSVDKSLYSYEKNILLDSYLSPVTTDSSTINSNISSTDNLQTLGNSVQDASVSSSSSSTDTLIPSANNADIPSPSGASATNNLQGNTNNL